MKRLNPKNQAIAGVLKTNSNDIQIGNREEQRVPNAINIIPGQNDAPGKVYLGNGEIMSGGEHVKLMGSTTPFPFSMLAGPVAMPQIVPIVPAFEHLPFLKKASAYSLLSLVR